MPPFFGKSKGKKTDSDNFDHRPPAGDPALAAAPAAAADEGYYRTSQQPHDPESYYPHQPHHYSPSTVASSDPNLDDRYYQASRYTSSTGTPDSKSLRDKASIGSASDHGGDIPSSRNKLFGRRQSVRREKSSATSQETPQDNRLPKVQEDSYAAARSRVPVSANQREDRNSTYLAYQPPHGARPPSNPHEGEDVIDKYLDRLLPQLSDQRFDVQRRNKKAQIESPDTTSAGTPTQDNYLDQPPGYQIHQQPHLEQALQNHSQLQRDQTISQQPATHSLEEAPYQPAGYQPQQPKLQAVQRQGSILRKQFVEQHTARSASFKGHTRGKSSESIDFSNLTQAAAGLSVPGNRSSFVIASQGASPHPQMSRQNTVLASGDGEGRDTAVLTSRQPADMSHDEVAQLMKDFKELREKYSKVKRYYFEKDDQVKSLQNTLAHQRLTQSRTAWDDGEYVQRFTRLDGLISQLAFGFRKDWKVLPAWIQPYVNKDAIQTGKQEMIAIGRAFISRWLQDEIFDKYFSPALDHDLSIMLKQIQHNMRNFHPAFQSGEEEEALISKIITWRLGTIDGLQHVFNSPEAATNKKALSDALEHRLVEELKEHMSDSSPPAGIEGGVKMIVELAISILSNLPFESRDVHIEYILPGALLDTEKMKIETGIPALTAPMAPGGILGHDGESLSAHSETVEPAHVDDLSVDESSKKQGFLGGLMNKAKQASNGGGSANHSQTSLAPPSSSGPGASKEDLVPRVRLCAFLALEIRGKMNLAKAPVYRA